MQTLRDELRAVPSIVGRAPDFDWTSAPDVPHEMFLQWLRYAIDAGVPEVHAATLSTVGEDDFPDARVLLVKDVTEDCGFKIATGDESAKGRQLLANPHCALTFCGARSPGLRHPQARAIALASRQNSVFSTDTARAELITQAEAAMEVDRGIVSPHWSVWTVVPTSVEFRQGDPSRNHQRLSYKRTGTTWDKQRLWP